MQPDERLIYQQLRLVDPEWYEPFDRYHPSDELLRAVRAIIPPTWRLRRSSIWFHVSPTEVKRPQQGWKIHISAIPANCEDVLCKAAVICVQRETPFKFALDQRIVDLMTSKGWSRPASGKFITIYPLNDQRFLEIIEALYAALDGLVGPYVLSDRRYKDAHTIYYRYGGIEEFTVVS